VARGGQRTIVQRSTDDLAALRAAIAGVDWAHIERGYVTRGAADLIVRDLLITLRGTTYETHADSLAKLPPPLRAVFDRLDDVYSRALKRPK
jgi:hypothetical protein